MRKTGPAWEEGRKRSRANTARVAPAGAELPRDLQKPPGVGAGRGTKTGKGAGLRGAAAERAPRSAPAAWPSQWLQVSEGVTGKVLAGRLWETGVGSVTPGHKQLRNRFLQLV